MSSVIISGDVSGTVTLQAPSAAGSTVVTLPSTSMNMGNGGGSVATNTAFGSSALAANTTGSNSVAFGSSALALAQDAINNTAVGANALAATVSGGRNTAVGLSALSANTASYNTAVGASAMQVSTTGEHNTAMGRSALGANTTGNGNVAIGSLSLTSNTTALYNTAVGYQSLNANTTASNSTAVGYQAGYSNTTGAYNTFFGFSAGNLNTTGTQNTYIGENAGSAMTTGSYNTIIGAYQGNSGGLDIRTANNYIVLSDGAGNPRMTFNGASAYINTVSALSPDNAYLSVAGSSSLPAVTLLGGVGPWVMKVGTQDTGGIRYMIGICNNSGATLGGITTNGTVITYGGTSDYRLKENIEPMSGALAKIAQLNPVTYTWKSNGSVGDGFIAHELAEVFPDAVAGVKDAVENDGSIKAQMIDQSKLVATLVAAIKELKAQVDAQAAEIATLKGQA